MDYLEFAPAFQNDREVVMAAVQQKGEALEFARTFRSDPEIACAAVRNNPIALNIIDPSLDKNDDFIECMIKYKIRGIGIRPVLQHHIRERLKIKMTEKSPHDTFSYGVKGFLGGRTRKQKRKRTRRR